MTEQPSSEQVELFPLEFSIQETPKSLQASGKSKGEWKNTVKAAANKRIADTVDWAFLDQRRLAVTILYFPPEEMEGDIDNVVKPILDGMIHAVYPSDKVIEKVSAQKLEPGLGWFIIQPSPSLEAALNMEPPVVYIRVDDDLKWREVSGV
jgi:Holliday junction resolvase RusA-like endonuclease